MIQDTVGLQGTVGRQVIKSRPVFFREPVFGELIKVVDLFFILVAAFIAYLLYRPLTNEFLAGDSERYIIPALLGSLLFVSLVSHLGGYDLKRLKQARWQVPRLIGVWILVISTFLMAAFFAKTSAAYSRLWTFSWTVLALGLILSQRGVLSFILNSCAQNFSSAKSSLSALTRPLNASSQSYKPFLMK